MISTKGHFHSKSAIILSSLLNIAFNHPQQQIQIKAVSIVSDIVLDIVHHGSVESCDKYYDLVLKFLHSQLEHENSLVSVSQLLITLSFAESGKRVSSWDPVLRGTNALITRVSQIESCSTELSESLAYLLIIVFRNCDVKDLTKEHKVIFEASLAINNGSQFLAFAEVCLSLFPAKVVNFGISKYIQEYIYKCGDDDTELKKLAYFLSRINNKKSVSLPRFTLGKELQTKIVNELKSEIVDIADNLQDVYWRLLLLSSAGEQVSQDSLFLVTILNELLSNKIQLDSLLSHDITSIVLESLTSTLNPTCDKNTVNSIYSSIILKLSSLKESSLFVIAFNNFITKFKSILSESINENVDETLNCIIENLCLPNQEFRLNSLELIITIYEVSGKEVLSILSQVRNIEQIPLNLSTGRDIQLRVRNLALEVKRDEGKLTKFDFSIVSYFTIGLLTNKFQPSWEAAFEALPNIYEKCANTLWTLCYKFIIFDYTQQSVSYFNLNEDTFMEVETELIEWQPRNSKLRENYVTVENNYFSKFRNIGQSISENGMALRADNTYSGNMRSQAIKALVTIPTLAENNSKLLVPLVLHDNDEDDIEMDEANNGDSKTKNWTLTDRNRLVSLFGKFKNVKKVYNSAKLYDHLLVLLSNKKLAVQNLALNVILNWGIGSINKYRDNLKNLLDDTIFREEISKFITQKAESNIEDKDLETLMPLVVRILFGRVQGTPKSNSKFGKKFAVISILPSLQDHDIVEFLKLGSDRLGFDEGEPNTEEVADFVQLRKLSGFVNLLSEVYSTLGQKHANVLATTIKPLVYALVSAQNAIDSYETGDEETDISNKTARTVRQVGMKCLSELFVILGDNYNWDEFSPIIYGNVIKPRLPNFASENSQQVSSLMKIMLGLIEFQNTCSILYIDEFAPAKAIIELLSNTNTKEQVLIAVFTFANKALDKQAIDDENYFTLLALLVDSLLLNLPTTIENITNSELGSLAIKVLLQLIDGNYVEDNNTKASLVTSLTIALDKPQGQIDNNDKVHILLSLSNIINDYDCTFEDIKPLYQACSKHLRVFPERLIRETLVLVFTSIGAKFIEIEPVGEILTELNAYSQKRMQELDFERRLNGFKRVNEEMYSTLNPIQWLPIIYCALFFINDEAELVIRTNAAYLLNRFVDCYSEKSSLDEAKPFIFELKNVILPHLRIGLRKKNEEIRSEYINVLAHIVEHSKFYDDLNDMKALNKNNDEESSFFGNVIHIQLHRRQRAIRRLVDHRNELHENSISHYILPIIEHYAISDDDKYTNIGLEVFEAISYLVRCLSWNHFKALLKRYISNVKNGGGNLLRNHVNILVSCAKAFMYSNQLRNEGKTEDVIKNLPKDQTAIDKYILEELFPPILKILVVRDDETVVARTPLAEALSCLLVCISEDKIESELPGVLISTCQVMRSRSEELRDAVRKTLSKIAKLLGPKYLVFILKELKTALSRGSQIHVLSFTVHYLLAVIEDSLNHGDLDDSVELIVEIIMEDIFGAAGQEKDAEGYHSKMKEVKFKKSFDSGEIVASNVSLASFSYFIDPIKLLLQEHLSLKTQNKLDELLRRYSLGLNHNDQGGSKEILNLCYEVNSQASKYLEERSTKNKKLPNASQEHFLVNLNSKTNKTETNSLLYIHTLQKFSMELLRTALSRHEDLQTVANLTGFLPLLEQGIGSENEGVAISSLRVMNSIIRLPFPEKEDAIFKTCARRSLNLIKDSPSTNSEICQAALRFLATAIRHKPEVQLKDTAVSYILLRIQPDLEEPNKQGLAFAFVKSVVSQHIMIPEIYDVIDKVSKIMVVNHSKEIRDMSRSVYYSFLMEYDQGRGKLEKQFKFLVSNLAYPTEEGRQSVMELLHQVIQKAGTGLIAKLATSFFVGLANVVVTDDSTRCKEMASTLIGNIFKNLGQDKMENIERYISAWLVQDKNSTLKRCGLTIYKIYVGQFGYGVNQELDTSAFENIEKIVDTAKNDDSNEDVQWELLYSALNVFSVICSKAREGIFAKKFDKIWKNLVEILLFPHAWIRLITSRLVGILLSNLDKVDFSFSNYEIQTIAYRLLRQLSAPSITEDLGTQIIKNMASLIMRWEAQKTEYESKKDTDDEGGHKYATDYVVSKTCAVMRQESNYKNSFVSKKSSIKLAALIVQILETDRLESAAESILLAMHNFIDTDRNGGTPEDEELYNLSMECMQLTEQKLGTTEYTKIYSKVQASINLRRQHRKTKRAQLAVNAPDIAAKRKLKKHERSREKRKHEKDENGYYRSKKNRFS
jgi:U3 small nucleolar RNA-associated protein 20